jgi:hypothetical protein
MEPWLNVVANLYFYILTVSGGQAAWATAKPFLPALRPFLFCHQLHIHQDFMQDRYRQHDLDFKHFRGNANLADWALPINQKGAWVYSPVGA